MPDTTKIADFHLVNDPDFFLGCMEFYDEKPPLQQNPFQTIGNRRRFIEILRKYGFEIVRSKNVQPPVVG